MHFALLNAVECKMTDFEETRLLLEALGQQVIALDEEFRVVYQNHSGEFEVGRSLLDQLGDEEKERARRALAECGSTHERKSFEVSVSGRNRRWTVASLPLGGAARFCISVEEPFDSTEPEGNSLDLRAALEASGVGLWSWHLPTDRVVWDQRMRAITGHQIPLNLPQWIEILTHPEDRKRVAEEASGASAPGSFGSQISRIMRPDGSVRWVLTAGTVVPNGGGEPEWIVGGLMDVTVQHRAAERLREAHKMEALGHLTSGVAHNFNNMLMIIAPCLEFIRETVNGDLLEDVNDALNATRRASEIVAQLMTFSGKQNRQEKAQYQAADLCERTIHLCRRSFPSVIELETEIVSQGTLECTPGSLEQVLGNLVFNARDAVMSQSSRSPRVQIKAQDVDYYGDKWIQITVSDSGPGVPVELRTKIFEPFVTTKPGRGTGLGLASAMAIVEQHGGQLAYHPSALGGAEFVVLLPALQESKEAAPESSSRKKLAQSPPREGVRRVLVVDDEPAIRRLLCVGLPRYGYEVVAAEGPTDLRETLEREASFDFVLLDRSLGAHDGLKLVPLLREKCPLAKIFFFTGEYIGESDAALVEGVISKPLNLRDLANVIEETMSA